MRLRGCRLPLMTATLLAGVLAVDFPALSADPTPAAATAPAAEPQGPPAELSALRRWVIAAEYAPDGATLVTEIGRAHV